MKKIAAAVSMALVAGLAGASTVQVQTGVIDRAADDFIYPTTSADFQSVVEQAVVGGSTFGVPSFDHYQTDIDSKAFDATITFTVNAAGPWDFRAGVDFGLGGTMVLDAGTANAIVLDTHTGDMWWAGDWDNANGVLAGSVLDLGVGTHTLSLYGMEDCCSGYQSVQFRRGNGTYTSFGVDDGLASAVPEAQSVAMLLAGLGLVGTMVRRRRQA